MGDPAALPALLAAALILIGVPKALARTPTSLGRDLRQSNGVDCTTAAGENFTGDPSQGSPCENDRNPFSNAPPVSCEFASQFPYITSLKDLDENHICGGVLVGKHWVLTAASCVDDSLDAANVFNPLVGIGGFELEEPVEVLKTNDTLFHPQWKQDRWRSNDLAMLRLERDSCVDPVLLPEDGQKTPGFALFGGFGRTTPDGGFVPGLRVGNFSMESHSKCNKGQELSQMAVKPMMCVRGTTSEAGGLCAGDQGGPFFIKPSIQNFQDTLFGIASFSDGECTDTDTPAIATSINNKKTLKWLRAKLFT